MYCKNCGKIMPDDAKFCPSCGTNNEGTPSGAAADATNNYGANPYGANPYGANPYGTNQYGAPVYPGVGYNEDVVKGISSREKANAIIWFVVAGIQYLIALVEILFGLNMMCYWGGGETMFINGLITAVIATLNIVSATKDMKFSKEVLIRPVGVVARYRNIGGYIVTLIYNIIFGGIVGIAGGIYGLVVRSYVMTREQRFMQIEQEFLSKNVGVNA